MGAVNRSSHILTQGGYIKEPLKTVNAEKEKIRLYRLSNLEQKTLDAAKQAIKDARYKKERDYEGKINKFYEDAKTHPYLLREGSTLKLLSQEEADAVLEKYGISGRKAEEVSASAFSLLEKHHTQIVHHPSALFNHLDQLFTAYTQLVEKAQTGTIKMDEILLFQDQLTQFAPLVKSREQHTYDQLVENARVILVSILESCLTTKSSSPKGNSHLYLTFQHEGQAYVVKHTLGDGACALHALLGLETEGVIQFQGPEGELAKRYYTNALETQLKGKNPTIEACFVDALTGYFTVKGDRCGDMLFKDSVEGKKLKSQWDQLDNDYTKRIDAAKVAEGKHWLPHVCTGSPLLEEIMRYVQRKTEENANDSPWYHKSEEEVRAMVSSQPQLLSNLISSEPSKYLAILKDASQRAPIQTLIDERRALNQHMEQDKRQFILSPAVIKHYVAIANKIPFYLNTSEIRLAAHLFNKKVQVVASRSSGIEPSEFLMNEHVPGDLIVIHHQGAHFSRCVRRQDPPAKKPLPMASPAISLLDQQISHLLENQMDTHSKNLVARSLLEKAEKGVLFSEAQLKQLGAYFKTPQATNETRSSVAALLGEAARKTNFLPLEAVEGLEYCINDPNADDLAKEGARDALKIVRPNKSGGKTESARGPMQGNQVPSVSQESHRPHISSTTNVNIQGGVGVGEDMNIGQGADTVNINYFSSSHPPKNGDNETNSKDEIADLIEALPNSTEKSYMQRIWERIEKRSEVHQYIEPLLEKPEHLELTFYLLDRSLPTFSYEEFQKCVAGSFNKLLEHSKHLPKCQMDLAHTTSKQYLKNRNLKESMRYSAIAFNIAHENNFKSKSIEIEEVQSQIFLSFLEKEHSRIQKELEASLQDPKAFHQKLEELFSLKRYCRTGESLQKVEDLFQIALDIKKFLNPAQKNTFASSNGLLMQGASLQSTEYDWIFITEDYRNHLKSYREIYTQEDHRPTREKQKDYTQKFKEFFSYLITDALIILGPPPCPFTFCSMGSISREEPTPSSDLEWVLLIENEEERSYFEKLTTFLELQCLSLGETPCYHTPLFTGYLIKGGFYLDTGKRHVFIGTPENILKEHLHTHIEPRSLAYTIHHLAPLYGEEGPFQAFLTLKRQKMPLEIQQKSALSLLKNRRKDFFSLRKKLQANKETPSFKRDYIEPLFHLLKDLALYYGIEEQNTLDITKKLPFTKENKAYLKEVISTLYLHRLKTDDPSVLLDDEKEKIECLLFEPLYHVLLKDFPYKKKQIDLFELQLERILLNKKLRTKDSMETFIRHLQPLSLKDETLERYYDALSNHIDPIEPLREAFLKGLKQPLAQKLAKVPNPFGERLILKRKRECFFQNLSELVSTEKAPGKKMPFAVSITSPFFQGGYLPSDAIDALFDKDGHIKKQMVGTNSRVARYSNGKLDFHFKEKPSNPSKESPFHPGREHAAGELMFRLFGRGTSISEIFECVVEGSRKGPKKYLILISETIPGVSPDPDNPPEIDPIQLSEMFLSLPLLLPGDMRPVNLIATPEKELISIDNDVSWIKPYTKEGCNLYTVLPFLYPDLTLHSQAIESFLALKPTALLMHWLEELMRYNNALLEDSSIQAYEEAPQKKHPKHYTSTCRFQRGTGGQLISQFYELQNFLNKNRHRPIKGAEILQTLLSLDEEALSLVGNKIHSDYEKAQKNPAIKASDKVKVVTRRRNTESISMTQSQGSFFDKIPKNAEELENYTPKNAYDEIERLSAIHFEGFFSEGELATLENGKGMQEINAITQKYLFKAFLLHTFEHLNLSHSVLDDKDLGRFLEKSGKTLKVLDLRHCPNLTEKAVTSIVDQCPVLEKLYLSHCPGIKSFAYVNSTFLGVNSQRASLPELKTLHLGDCPALERIQIEAPKLERLKANDTSSLKTSEICVPLTASVTLEKECVLPEGFRPFGPTEWETYFGEVEPLPCLDFLAIIDILNSPCPFWEGKKVYETHLLVFIPETVNGEPFHLNALKKLIKSPKTGYATQYNFYEDIVQKEVRKKQERSYWALMTRDVIPHSRRKTYQDQKALLKQHAEKSGIPYKLPKALEASTAILMEHVQTGTRLYPDDPCTYTRCQDRADGFPFAIGAFNAFGLSCPPYYVIGSNTERGVSALREFR